MKLKGTVLGVIFCNEENGYTVLEFDANGNYCTAVGIFPMVVEGESLVLTGEFKQNKKFGQQFVVTEVEYLKPENNNAIITYLASGLFDGIGEKMAVRLVDTFGKNTLDVIEKTPELLRTVSGIGRKTANKIIECYQNTVKMKESLLFLQANGISMNMALKIYKEFGENTSDIVKDNPYVLVQHIDGVGFLTADKIAIKIGIPSDSIYRIRAGIHHILGQAGSRGGHTCLPKNEVYNKLCELISETTEELFLDALMSMDTVKSISVEETEFLQVNTNYFIEKNIASRIISINGDKSDWGFDIERELNHYQRGNNIELDDSQIKAIVSILNNGVSVITGGPGTGKTTIIKGITTIMQKQNKKVMLCAPTGRASKRMTEATGVEAKTIHRLLNVDFSGLERRNFDEMSLLDVDVLIVDEISMADIFVFNALVNSIPAGARLVLVGDKDQLPSVSCGNILSDIINTDFINVVYLNEIYRQAKNSMIVINAHRINKGEMPLSKIGSDFFIEKKSDSEGILKSVVSMVKNRIPNYLNINSSAIQVLAPMKKGTVGVENINIELQKELNRSVKCHKNKDTIYKLGDKVMQTVNNYNIEWKKTDSLYDATGQGVFNGDIGYIAEVYSNGVSVLFDDGKFVTYKGGEVDELMLAYCVSVHKSQGCEFDVVIIVITNGNYMIMTKNLLYTAVTRAKKMAVIVGEVNNIHKMVQNNYTQKRYSMLRYFLLNAKKRRSLLWGEE